MIDLHVVDGMHYFFCVIGRSMAPKCEYCRGTERYFSLSVKQTIDWLNLVQRDHARISGLSKRLIDSINARVSHVIRNGDAGGYPGCVNLSFAYVEGESLLMALKVRWVTIKVVALSN